MSLADKQAAYKQVHKHTLHGISGNAGVDALSKVLPQHKCHRRKWSCVLGATLVMMSLCNGGDGQDSGSHSPSTYSVSTVTICSLSHRRVLKRSRLSSRLISGSSATHEHPLTPTLCLSFQSLCTSLAGLTRLRERESGWINALISPTDQSFKPMINSILNYIHLPPSPSSLSPFQMYCSCLYCTVGVWFVMSFRFKPRLHFRLPHVRSTVTLA